MRKMLLIGLMIVAAVLLYPTAQETHAETARRHPAAETPNPILADYHARAAAVRSKRYSRVSHTLLSISSRLGMKRIVGSQKVETLAARDA